MKIVQEIGSYAGLAAIVGLAVLAALYFSQARDVKRLREWAGRAPERGPDTAPAVVAQPQTAARPQAPATRAPVRPVPRAPGQTSQQPQVKPSPAAAAAAAGAAPATAAGPAAATPAARAAGTATPGTDEEEQDATAASNGTDEQAALLNQDTVVHPPPTPPGEDDEAEDSEERDALGDDSGEYDAVEDSAEYDALEDDEDDEDWEDSEERDELPPEAHWEDTGDEPPVTPAPSTPAGAARPAPAVRSALPRDPAPAASASGGSILPPYEESRPGGAAEAGDDRDGTFSSRRRAVGVIGGAVVVLAVIVFGATRLLGGGDDSTDNASAPQGGGGAPQTETSTTPSRQRPRNQVNPASVRVAILNGTTVPGLAAQIGDDVSKQGFKLGTVTNFNDQQRAESVVLYAPGAEREAAEVGRRLKITQREPIDPESQSVAGDATVVLVTGRDKTQ